MKKDKFTPRKFIIVLSISSCLIIGYKLGIDVNKTKIKKLEKEKQYLIELLNDGTEQNERLSFELEKLKDLIDNNNFTIEEIMENNNR